MTISGTNSRNDYLAGGASCTFAYTFPITAATSLAVYVCNVLVTNYSVTGAGSASGGSITFSTVPAASSPVAILRAEPYTQGLDLVEHGNFSADSLETELDKTAMLDQQLLEKMGRTPQLPPYAQVCNVVLALPQAAAYLRWSSDCSTIETSSTVATGSLSVPASFTSGSIVFASAAQALTQDNANLYWDDSNNRLGLGTATPLTSFHDRSCGTTIYLPTASQNNYVHHYVNPVAFGTTQEVVFAAETCGISTGSTTAGRIAGYFGAATGGGTGPNTGNPIWALNATVTQKATDSEARLIGFEMDVNNNRSNSTSTSNCQVGFSAVSGGSKTASIAYYVSGLGLWCNGIVVASGGIAPKGYAFRYLGDGTNGDVAITANGKLQMGFTTVLGDPEEIHMDNGRQIQELNGARTALIPMLAVSSCNRVIIDKNANGVQFGCTSVASAVPGNFAANRIIYFRDGAGNVLAIPAMLTSW